MSLAANLSNFATRVATEIKLLKGMVSGGASNLSELTTTQKSSLVGAVNELKSLIVANGSGSGGVAIDDASVSSTTSWSSSKTNSEISSRFNLMIDGAPAALDTLNELAAAINDDANFSAVVTQGLVNRVRTDIGNQGLDTAQKSNARANIDAAPTGHKHTASDVTSGTFDSARLPMATEFSVGAVELANSSETATGTDTARAVTPHGLRFVMGDPENNLVSVFEQGLI